MLNIRRIFFICKYYAKINYTFIEKLFILFCFASFWIGSFLDLDKDVIWKLSRFSLILVDLMMNRKCDNFIN